jgi:very-short-patch-repair endonuclease
MSLNSKNELRDLAKNICRELRKNSTTAENLMWSELRNHKLGGLKFYRQFPIFYDLEGKESFFVADFYCHENSLIVELDGETHLYRIKEDTERTKILNHLGLKVVRIKNEEVMNNIEFVLGKIFKCN